jgi:hypothetical protein
VKYIVAILLFTIIAANSLFAQKSPMPIGEGEDKTTVRFYPNPAVNFITFEMKKPVEPGTAIHVFSFLGRQIAQVPVNAQRVTVNVSDYFRGVYVFQLRAPSGRIIETNKFQVSR